MVSLREEEWNEELHKGIVIRKRNNFLGLKIFRKQFKTFY